MIWAYRIAMLIILAGAFIAVHRAGSYPDGYMKSYIRMLVSPPDDIKELREEARDLRDRRWEFIEKYRMEGYNELLTKHWPEIMDYCAKESGVTPVFGNVIVKADNAALSNILVVGGARFYMIGDGGTISYSTFMGHGIDIQSHVGDNLLITNNVISDANVGASFKY